MYALDDAFLADSGLGSLCIESRGSLLRTLRTRLETRVGRRLSEGMSDGQLVEFEALVDRDRSAVVGWLSANASGYRDDPLFQSIGASMPDASAEEVEGEYAATAWLRLHRPGYRDVVVGELNALRDEVRAAAPAILREAGLR